jgi:ATP-dependent Clp endopeptidase proteolytic subunit ClpP
VSTKHDDVNEPSDEKPEENPQQINFVVPNDITPELPKMRTIGLYGEVNADKGSELVYSFLMMHHEAPKTQLVNPDDPDCEEEETVMLPFKFIICTPGGHATDMFAVYDIMRVVREDCEIEVLGLGEVMSAGVLLLAAGTKGKRAIAKNCRLMLHSVSAGHHGSIDNLENQMVETKWIQKRYIKALATETKMSEKQIKKIMSKKNDHYLDAEEAVKLGIADKVV